MKARAAALRSVAPSVAPAVVEAVRTWRPLALALADQKDAIAEARRLEDAERKARAALGDLLGESKVVVVDGEAITYEKGTRGGNAADLGKAWEALRASLADAGAAQWVAHMDELAESYRTAPTTIHKLAVAPVRP